MAYLNVTLALGPSGNPEVIARTVDWKMHQLAPHIPPFTLRVANDRDRAKGIDVDQSRTILGQTYLMTYPIQDIFNVDYVADRLEEAFLKTDFAQQQDLIGLRVTLTES